MARYFGKIGYEITEETTPGVWVPAIVEREYYGNLLRNSRRLSSSDKVIDDIAISNEISIVADAYAYQNFHLMRYAVYLGSKWKITNVEVQRPRLVLTLGGVYNG